MRSSWTAAFVLAPLLSFAAPAAHAEVERAESTQDLEVLEFSRSTAYTKFAINCPGCFNSDSEADDSLVFDFQVGPSDDLWVSHVTVDDQPLDISWRNSGRAEGSQFLNIADSTGELRSVRLSWSGLIDTPPPSLWTEDYATQNVLFTATPINRVSDTLLASVSFVVFMRPTQQDRLVGLMSEPGSQLIDFARLDENYLLGSPVFENGIYDDDPFSDNNAFDVETELESLALLEHKAQEVQAQIVAKKKAIAHNLKQEHDKLCLKHLIKECDGIVCAAKAIAQRLCDKVGLPAGHSLQYAHIKTQQTQNMVALDEKMPLEHHLQEANLPLMLTKNTSSHSHYTFQPIHLVNPPNPLMRALQIIGACLGITALLVFLKRRCMSMRRRVERAADLEQRRNERAYRRAARRALMRKRWQSFVGAFNCFGRKEVPRIADYEEKRALILQDAFLEQDLDQAEKGEIMEAEIRELRYAHEIVSSLVRVDEHRYDLITPFNDPPPPLVPLPRTPGPRSRASTYTLPSYTSETLPDYSSRVSDSDGSSSLVNGYTSSTSDEQNRRSPPSSVTSSARTKYTPTSSVRETSPRPSQETIRTRPSNVSRD